MWTIGGGGACSWSQPQRPSRYESQKWRDWQTFTRYLAAHRPPLEMCHCSGAHVLEFLRYLDRFGKTRVHVPLCAAYGGGGNGRPAEPCQCPLRQAWGSLDALVGRLRAAFEERRGTHGTGIWTSPSASLSQQQPQPSVFSDGDGANPFAAREVRLYLRYVRGEQSRARGIAYTKKKTKGNKQQERQDSAAAATAAAGCSRPHVNGAAKTLMHAATPPSAPPPPPPPVPSYYLAVHNDAPAGFDLSSLFNTFGQLGDACCLPSENP